MIVMIIYVFEIVIQDGFGGFEIENCSYDFY